MDSPEGRQDGQITRIGKYEVIDVLGRGGMGVVYRGIDKAIGREVAIKTLTGGFLSDPTMLARFYEEGRRTGRLKHPNIVTVYDLGDDNGTPYIVMECVEGDPLDKLIRSGAPLSMADRLGILEEVCSALGYAHRNNVIHRDVKPANIFVQPDGTAKLLDFGIARLEKRDQDISFTRTGRLIGTVPYMAPERLLNETVDGRSDIFAAGVVLYQLVAGQLPFSGNENALMQRILNDPYPPLSSLIKGYPPILDSIMERSLAKAPDERYPTAEEMAADLNNAIAELRQEQVLELLPEALRLVEAQEFTRARGILHQLLKIDSKHAEARKLLGEIQRHFTQRQREEKIQQIRLEAEDAINNRRYDQSLAVLADGLDLDALNPELVKLRDKANREKEKEDRINEYLRQAETARRKGDFGSAITAAQKALKVDKTNSKIVALCNLLEKEAEQAKRKAQAKTLLTTARSELSARHYAEAIGILERAEEFDPTNPELPLLIRDANSGLEQAKRKELIAGLEEQVALAITFDLLQRAAQSIQEAMAAMPSEAALFRLNAQVERQIKEHENRMAVDETVQACRDLNPREALELVRKAMHRLPGDERLLSLEALLTERFRQQTVDERRAAYMSRAREALKNGKYSDAVGILEFCQAEGLAESEILSLLDFARKEELENRRQDQLRGKLARAQSLIAESAFDEAIEFLESALQQDHDTALRLILDQASAGREALRQQIEAGLASARKLSQAGKTAEAIQLLQMQPPSFQRSARVQTALVVLEEERQQALYRMIGRAYAALGVDLPAGEAVMRRAAKVSANSPVMKSVATAFRSRVRTYADRVIADAIQRSKLLLRDKDREASGNLLQSVSSTMDYASPELKTDYQKAQKLASKGTLTRFRA